METTVYSQTGEVMGKTKLPESIFGLPWNADLVHQVVVSMESSSRRNTAHTKNRGEVRGGGKKPWKQKGTGQARHGSTRSPIWVGGGVAHGPRNEKNYDRKVNRKMKTKALFVILSKKFKNGEIVFVDTLSLKEPKTKLAIGVLKNLHKVPELGNVLNKRNALSIFMPERHADLYRSFRNISNVLLEDTRSINPVSLLSRKRILFVAPEETMRILEGKTTVSFPGEERSSTDEKLKKAVVRKVSKPRTKAKVRAK